MATPEEADRRFVEHFIALSIRRKLDGDIESSRRLRLMVVREIGEQKARELELARELQLV